MYAEVYFHVLRPDQTEEQEASAMEAAQAADDTEDEKSVTAHVRSTINKQPKRSDEEPAGTRRPRRHDQRRHTRGSY